jgi:hypothetical protein
LIHIFILAAFIAYNHAWFNKNKKPNMPQNCWLLTIFQKPYWTIIALKNRSNPAKAII